MLFGDVSPTLTTRGKMCHDTYVLFLTDNEISTSDEWIIDSFNDALETYARYLDTKKQAARNDKEETERKESENMNHQEIQRMIDQALVKRTLA